MKVLGNRNLTRMTVRVRPPLHGVDMQSDGPPMDWPVLRTSLAGKGTGFGGFYALPNTEYVCSFGGADNFRI